MSVRELIALLQVQDPDANVITTGWRDGDLVDITKVKCVHVKHDRGEYLHEASYRGSKCSNPVQVVVYIGTE